MTKKRPKNILVTGLSGYLGSFLLDELQKQNWRVFAIEKKLPHTVPKKVKFLRADIAKRKDLARYKKTLQRADAVLHLAAFVPKSPKLDDLKESIKVNLEGSINLALFLRPKTKFIFASTCEVYARNVKADIKENYQTAPSSFYGAGKLAAEKYLQVLCAKKNIGLTILRFASIYGPGEKISRAIPNFIKAALRDENIYIFGEGKEKRSFIFAKDAAKASITALKYKKSGLFNIASEEKISILSLAKLIRTLSGSGSKIIFRPRQKAKTNVVLNIDRAKRELKFESKTDLKTGLIQEIEFFKKEGDKLVVFDLDGTLLDVSKRYYETYRFILRKRNQRVLSKKTYWDLKRRKTPDRTIIAKTSRIAAFEYEAERNKLVEDKRFLRFDKAVPGARQALDELKKRHLLFLLTARKNRKNLLWQLNKLKLAKYFDKILSSKSRAGEPLEVKISFMRKIKNAVPQGSIAIIGDTEADILAGKKEGVLTIGVLYGIRRGQFIRKLNPDFKINRIGDVFKFL